MLTGRFNAPSRRRSLRPLKYRGSFEHTSFSLDISFSVFVHSGSSINPKPCRAFIHLRYLRDLIDDITLRASIGRKPTSVQFNLHGEPKPLPFSAEISMVVEKIVGECVGCGTSNDRTHYRVYLIDERKN